MSFLKMPSAKATYQHSVLNQQQQKIHGAWCSGSFSLNSKQ